MCGCLFFITNFIVSLFFFFPSNVCPRFVCHACVCLTKTIWMTIFEYNCCFNILFRSIMMAFGLNRCHTDPTKKVKDKAPLNSDAFLMPVKEQMTTKSETIKTTKTYRIEFRFYLSIWNCARTSDHQWLPIFGWHLLELSPFRFVIGKMTRKTLCRRIFVSIWKLYSKFESIWIAVNVIMPA